VLKYIGYFTYFLKGDMANKITAWDLPSIGTGIGSSVQSEGRTEKPMAWGKGIFWRWEWEEVGVE
jgi:hypothetical protein